MVITIGFEPTTTTMSRWHSTAELRDHNKSKREFYQTNLKLIFHNELFLLFFYSSTIFYKYSKFTFNLGLLVV